MGHTFADLVVHGLKGKCALVKVVVDTGATYTVLPKDVVEAIEPARLPVKTVLELGNGRIVEAETYAMVSQVGGREGPIIAVTFEGAKTVIGVQALESLGFKVNPVTGALEETRPKGVAYFYRGF